ncbi:MAG TPA: hypothetical protein DCX46_05370, partial [Bacteroidetes bacterium]|nr:hypothetical protein [Bacteroidota bacterium]
MIRRFVFAALHLAGRLPNLAPTTMHSPTSFLSIPMKFTSILILLIPLMAFAQKADLILVNGKVWTVDAARPTAQAVAVVGDRILAVGTTKEIRAFASPSTKVVDLKGRLLLPGFIDNHTHFMSGGFQLQSVDLRYAKNETDFSTRIKERAMKYPERWITGGDW